MPFPFRFLHALALLAALLLPATAAACLWDYDTLKMERTRFPGTLELITGKFLRHSPEFYQWRIENRRARLQTDPNNVELLDDLAVAYSKTGQHEKAIEAAMRIEKIQPGRYETAANLGSFYFHAGKLTEGIPYIDKALRINPDAHFGREKYQKLLVEYVLKQRKGQPGKLPLARVAVSGKENVQPWDIEVQHTFADHIREDPSSHWALTPREAVLAIKGILGMMKFGKYDSPVLLEALGTLLTQQNAPEPNEDAKQLAARAYLKASYEVPEGEARDQYRAMAARALYMQISKAHNTSQLTVELLEPDFKKELEEARLWYAELRERELSWIRDGMDPEAEFDKLYEMEPEVSGMEVRDPLTPSEKIAWVLKWSVRAFIASMLVAALVVIHYVKKRFWRKPSQEQLSV